MIDDKITRLSRQALARQRLKVPADADVADLLLPENVARFLRAEVSPALLRREHLGAIFIDEDIRPIVYSMPYRGYLGRVRIQPRKLLTPAVMVGASGLIVFHNRPRRRRSPNQRDAAIARRVRAACELMALRLLDYLILGDGDAWSSLHRQRRVRFHAPGDRLPLSSQDGRARVQPKYRNPDPPHQTWSGRGRMAKWLRDKIDDEDAKLEDFLIVD